MKIRNTIKFIGMGFLLLGFILFVDMFYAAYLSPDKEVCVAIDYFHEANLEAFLFVPLMIVFGGLSVIIIFYEIVT